MRLTLSLILLASGALLYALFRPDVLFLIPVKDLLPPQAEVNGPILSFAAYNLPDALWYGSLLALQPDKPVNKCMKWLTVITMSLPFVLEASQLFRLLPGTFDLGDLCCYTIVLIIYTTIQWKRNLRERK